MQDIEYSYQTLKEVFYVYGCMLNYKVDSIVVDRVNGIVSFTYGYAGGN